MASKIEGVATKGANLPVFNKRRKHACTARKGELAGSHIPRTTKIVDNGVEQLLGLPSRLRAPIEIAERNHAHLPAADRLGIRGAIWRYRGGICRHFVAQIRCSIPA